MSRSTTMSYSARDMPPIEERSEYPRCPRCGGPVVSAAMTSRAVEVIHGGERRHAYLIEAVSVYCCNAECNYDKPLAHIPYPPPDAERGQR